MIKIGDRVRSTITRAEGRVVGDESSKYADGFGVLVEFEFGNEIKEVKRELLEKVVPKSEWTYDKRDPADAPPARPAGYSDEEYYDSDAYYNWERSPEGRRWNTPDHQLPETESTDDGDPDLPNVHDANLPPKRGGHG